MSSDRKPELKLVRGRGSSSSHGIKAEKIRCKVCLDKTDIRHMLSLHRCTHKLCESCAKQYLEVKLQESTNLPACRHLGCKSRIRIRNCKKVLKPELVKLLKQRLKESRIPVQERIYCPYPKCSYLMSKVKILELSEVGKRKGKKKISDKSKYRKKCLKCGGKFCVECKVSWHNDMTCSDYKKLNPYSCEEDKKLATLAKKNSWIQCIKCGHMIERSFGCRNIRCRCGCKLCYCCGTERENRKRIHGDDSTSEESDSGSDSCQCDISDSDSDFSSCSSG